MKHNSVVSRTHSAGVGDNQCDTIKTVIISFITISLTGEPNSPFSFNLPNGNLGLEPYLELQATQQGYELLSVVLFGGHCQLIKEVSKCTWGSL